MNLKNYKPLVNLPVIAGIAYLLHKFILHSLKINVSEFQYSIEVLYFLFFIMSAVIFIVVLKVKEKSFDNVGMSFLLGTSIKMIFCFLILKPILRTTAYDSTIEKVNFFVMFILFLLIETVLTMRILNEKQ